MNKIKIALICLLIPIFVFMAFTFIQIKHKREYQQKVVLALELRKILEPLMFDLSEVRENTIQDVPADGLWHHRVAFILPRKGRMEYLVKTGRLFRINNGIILMVADNIGDLRIRRYKDTPHILEIQIEARKNVSLMSTLKIRLLQ